MGRSAGSERGTPMTIHTALFRKTITGSVFRGGRCFTLVELLVVIGIIAILASMLLPLHRKSLSLAYQAGCKNNMRQVGIGWQQWVLDHNDKILPRMSGESTSSVNLRGITSPLVKDVLSGSTSTDGVDWIVMLQSYLSLGSWAWTGTTNSAYWTFAVADRDGIFNCPASDETMESIRSSKIGMPIYNIGGNNLGNCKSVTKVNEIFTPSRKILFADTNINCYYSDNSNDYLNFTRHNGLLNLLMIDLSSSTSSMEKHSVEAVLSSWWMSEAWGFGRQSGSSW